jgi:hypothetical protein
MTTRTCFIFDQKWPGNQALRMRLPDVAQAVAFLLPCSKDGRSGYRVGIDASDTTKVSIKPVVFGVIGSAFATVASDTPPSSTAIVAHGVAAATPILIEVRYIDGTIELRVNDVVKLSWAGAGAGAYGAYTHFGFDSDVAGAVVTKIELATLVKTDPDAQTEVWLGVCDGNVVCSLDGVTAQVIGQAAFPPGVPVTLKAYQGHVVGIGGGNARKIDPRLLTVLPWGGTTATTALPGAIESATPGVYIAGTTRMTLLENDGDRLAMGGDPQDEQNVWWCALGDDDDWDVSAIDRPGRAFATSFDFPGRIGEPVTALKQASDGFLIIGCKTSVWRKQGDPAIAIPHITPAAIGTGITGKDAMALAVSSANGTPVTFTLAHTTAGFAAIPNSGPIIPLSPMVLTEGIQLPRGHESEYRVIVRRDTQRHNAMIYLTKVVSGSSLHFAYDERTGQFSPQAGGFMPDAFPDLLGPMSACVYRGQLLIGTRDGRVLFVDDSVDEDDGETIVPRMAAQVMDEPDTSMDTILSRMAITPGLESGPINYAVYAGRTPEEAYQGAQRRLLFSGVCEGVQGAGRPITRVVRAPALVLELSAPNGGAIEVERVEMLIRRGRILTRKIAAPIPTVMPLCPFPATVAADDGDDGPGPGDPYMQYLWEDQLHRDMIQSSTNDEQSRIMVGEHQGGNHTTNNGGQDSMASGDGTIVPF